MHELVQGSLYVELATSAVGAHLLESSLFGTPISPTAPSGAKSSEGTEGTLWLVHELHQALPQLLDTNILSRHPHEEGD